MELESDQENDRTPLRDEKPVSSSCKKSPRTPVDSPIKPIKLETSTASPEKSVAENIAENLAKIVQQAKASSVTGGSKTSDVADPKTG